MVLPDNSLEVNIGELRIDDFNEVFNELLPNADFAMVLPTLIDLALQALITNQLKFNLDITNVLSDALGGAPIFLRINDVVRDGIQDDFMTLTMTFTATRSTNLSLAAETFAVLHENDGLHKKDEFARIKPTGRIRMNVGTPLAYSDQQALEYQIRVDRGVWRVPYPARPDGTVYVADSHLMLPGTHLVQVRARYQDQYETLDATPAEFEVLIDPIAPHVAARMNDAGLRIDVEDAHSPARDLSLFGRFDDESDWFEIDLEPQETTEPVDASAEVSAQNALATGLFDLAEAGTHETLHLKGKDAIGNESPVIMVRIGQNAQLETDAANAQACACQSLGSKQQGRSASTLGGLALLGALLVRRRRRRD